MVDITFRFSPTFLFEIENIDMNFANKLSVRQNISCHRQVNTGNDLTCCTVDEF